jgi:hypothetical protein
MSKTKYGKLKIISLSTCAISRINEDKLSLGFIYFVSVDKIALGNQYQIRFNHLLADQQNKRYFYKNRSYFCKSTLRMIFPI